MAHPKRIFVLALLKNGEKTVHELAKETRIPQANLSQHLGILKHLGILERRRDGSSIYYRIVDHRVVEACELVRQTIGEKLRRSEAVLEVAA